MKMHQINLLFVWFYCTYKLDPGFLSEHESSQQAHSLEFYCDFLARSILYKKIVSIAWLSDCCDRTTKHTRIWGNRPCGPVERLPLQITSKKRNLVNDSSYDDDHLLCNSYTALISANSPVCGCSFGSGFGMLINLLNHPNSAPDTGDVWKHLK